MLIFVVTIVGAPALFFVAGCLDVNKKSILTSQEYAVFAWNDLGMHCLNPTYDTAVILPPYNTVWVEVIKRGDPPELVTDGIAVTYKLKNNTSSSDKREYGGFWTPFRGVLQRSILGSIRRPDDQNELLGETAVFGDHFEAVRMPVVPVNDNGKWNPFQIAAITAMDQSGKVQAETEATVPTSDEINCAKCHGTDPFDDIIVLLLMLDSYTNRK